MSESSGQTNIIEAKAIAEQLILVDETDREIGTGEKLAVHRSGKLHRAFSIFVFDDSGRLLLQKRAIEKYHSGGLWSNTCCGHPRPGEETIAAATRRLGEEMDFQCPLRAFFSFRYRATLENNLVENEYDHVLIGKFNGEPRPNPAEAEAWKWINFGDLKTEVNRQPEAYTYWLRVALDRSEWNSLFAQL